MKEVGNHVQKLTSELQTIMQLQIEEVKMHLKAALSVVNVFYTFSNSRLEN